MGYDVQTLAAALSWPDGTVLATNSFGTGPVVEITGQAADREPTGWFVNPCVLQWDELEDHTGPVDDDCNTPNQPYPDWVRQLVADHTPGTVTDAMLDAAYDALEVGGGCAQDVPEAAMRAALTAALHAQIGARP